MKQLSNAQDFAGIFGFEDIKTQKTPWEIRGVF